MTSDGTSPDNLRVLDKAEQWFRDVVIENHITNTRKLRQASEFNLNPFLSPYLSAFLTGEVSAEGIARALVYARVLGPSITTSFGTNLQSFISEVLVNAYGSVTSGVDIVFTDKVDGEIKYAQLKLGPNTINRDDIQSIHSHFTDVRNRARVNRVRLSTESLIIGIMYGSNNQISQHYRTLRDEFRYPTYVGSEFWRRLTGDENFFVKLNHRIAANLASVNSISLIEDTIRELAQDPQIIQMALGAP